MRSGRKRGITGLGVALLFVLAFAIFFHLNFKRVIVEGPSMEPTLHHKSWVMVTKAYWLVGALGKKDIVLLTDTGPTGYMIKRIYATAGDHVDRANWPLKHDITQGDYIVPPGHIFVVGDNRLQSQDSRDFGPVPLSNVLGKVVISP